MALVQTESFLLFKQLVGSVGNVKTFQQGCCCKVESFLNFHFCLTQAEAITSCCVLMYDFFNLFFRASSTS